MSLLHTLKFNILLINLLQTLTFLKKSGPSLNEAIPDGYNRCLVAGLLSPRLMDIQPSSLSQVRWFLFFFFEWVTIYDKNLLDNLYKSLV